ncbi:sensor histidine kinase [Actinophytocola xanthii]|uniref:histidine kinase n=1 Tax=Actinophytocola xanthii TaxID=1912961 RepID=A0A1Q8C918_9PSEU|nr:sensor histidine kinase [Actinophytocola xanthii]OLF10846.1 two-component sensor histidine kinase [Actinophytocola xanthii]
MQDRLTVFYLPARAQDVLLALFVTVMQVQGTVVRNAGAPEPAARHLSDLGQLGYALLVLSGLALVVRRRRPVAVFAVTALASLAYYLLGFPDGPGWLGLFVATYTLTALGDGRRSLVTAGAGIAVLAACWLVAAADVEPPAAIGWVFFRIGASVMSAALGESVRSRRVVAAEALARAELAERSREEEARARVDEERLRIAREVHDTVAHAIAIINVQSGVTAHVLDKRPDRARETLEAIERTSSHALREMRAILGVLREDGDDGDQTAPYPGLGQLDELTAQAREAGLEVDLVTTSPPHPVPGAVGSAVYRILQESITNVIRHVGPTRVRVELDFGADTAEVRVRDEGRRSGTRVETGPAGRGILGMRERCQLLGGELDAGPLPDGGFAVTARLPLAPIGTVSG